MAGTDVMVDRPLLTIGLASARTPVSLLCELIAAAIAIALALGSLLDAIELDFKSSATVVARILMPLITRSSTFSGLACEAILALTLVFVIVDVALLDDDIDKVKGVPGVLAVISNSLSVRPAATVTPRFS